MRQPALSRLRHGSKQPAHYIIETSPVSLRATEHINPTVDHAHTILKTHRNNRTVGNLAPPLAGIDKRPFTIWESKGQENSRQAHSRTHVKTLFRRMDAKSGRDKPGRMIT